VLAIQPSRQRRECVFKETLRVDWNTLVVFHTSDETLGVVTISSPAHN